jgi:cytochrome bd-type quinol oxidase subunit 1
MVIVGIDIGFTPMRTVLKAKPLKTSKRIYRKFLKFIEAIQFFARRNSHQTTKTDS